MLVVVAAEGLAVDEGERGDDEDDAGRCRSDARGQPSTAFVAAERVGGTVARAGVDIARLREKSFRECPRLSLPEMEAASWDRVPAIRVNFTSYFSCKLGRGTWVHLSLDTCVLS